jgi:hypothetical protein
MRPFWVIVLGIGAAWIIVSGRAKAVLNAATGGR